VVQDEGIFSKDYTEDEFKPKADEVSYVWSFVKMLFVLGIMVAVFYYFFKYVSKKTNINVSSEGISKTLSVIPIAQNKFLQIVDLGGKILVLGVSDNSINLITEITEKHEIDRLRVSNSTDSRMRSNQASFGDFFKRQVGHVLDRVSNKTEKKFDFSNEYANEHDYGFEQKIDLEYLKKQRSRLKKLNGVSNE
jgi:flagellar protein FliO/FliZ